MRRYGLRDEQWARVAPLLPSREGHVGGTAADNRLFVEALLHRYRAGIAWRDLPEGCGKWKSVYQRFDRRARDGAWERAFAALSADADNEDALLDSTIVRAHRHGAGARKKRRWGRGYRAQPRWSEHHDPCRGQCGNPVAFHLTSGQAHDTAGADALLGNIAALTVIVDKGYDAEERVLAPLREAGKAAVIPPKRDRKKQREYDRELYAARHLIEHFFCKLKGFRGLATTITLN